MKAPFYLSLLIFTFLNSPVFAQETEETLKELQGTLSENPSLTRHTPAVLRLRKQPNFIVRLVALSHNPKQSALIRLRAIQLIGECGENLDTAKTLLVLGMERRFPAPLLKACHKASERIQNRIQSRKHLEGQLSSPLPSVQILAEIKSLALDPLTRRDQIDIRKQAIRLLSQLKTFPIQLFATIIKNENDEPAIRAQALTIVVAAAPNKLDELIRVFLMTEQEALYNTALQSIKTLSAAGYAHLQKSLKEAPNQRERLRACELLSELRWVAATRDFDRIRQNFREPPVLRVECLRALIRFGKVNQNKAAAEQIKLLSLLEVSQRWRAIRALSELQTPIITEAVSPLFSDPTRASRKLAIQLSHALNLNALSQQLRRLALNKEEQDVNRALAIKSLGLQKSEPNIKTLIVILKSDPNPLIQRTTIEAIALADAPDTLVRTALEKALQLKDQSLKSVVIKALARHGNRTSADKLCQLIQNPENSERLNAAILQSLIQLPRPKNTTALLQLNSQSEATATLQLKFFQLHPDKNAVEALLSFLDHRAIAIRAGAWRLLVNWLPPKVMNLPEGSTPFQFSPQDPPANRQRASSRWRSWWKKHKETVSIHNPNNR
jgi:HEAT repeat protein